MKQQTCSFCLVCMLMLLVLLMVDSSSAASTSPQQQTSQNAADDVTVVVDHSTSQPVVLQSMFNISVQVLVLRIPAFKLVVNAWNYISSDTPYVMARNFTIMSEHSPSTVLDLAFLESKVALQAGNVFLFKDMVLTNTSVLDPYGIQWFVNSPGAVVRLHNAIVVDLVCNATDVDQDVQTAQSLPQIPGQARNLVSKAPATCLELASQRQCFQHGVHMQSLTVAVVGRSRRSHGIAMTKADAAAAVQQGAFMYVFQNTTRFCYSYLSMPCLQQHVGNEAFCWEQQAAALRAASDADTPSQSGLSSGAIAGIAVSGAVALAAACAVAVLLRRRSRRSKGQLQQVSLCKDVEQPNEELKPDGPSMHCQPSLDGSAFLNGTPGSDTQLQRTASDASAMPGAQRPSYGQDGISLGILLGAGSYGRVFKGRWHGREVAVKIINCTPEDLPKVFKEAEIMMQLDHPHIVRALNCITHDRRGRPAASRAQGQGAGSSDPNSSGRQVASAHDSGGSRHPSTGGSSGSSVKRMLQVLDKSHQTSPQQGNTPNSQAARTSAAGQPAASPSQAAASAVSSQVSGPLTTISQQEQQQPQLLQQQQPAGTGSDAWGSGSPNTGPEEDQEHVAEVWMVLELCTAGNLQDSLRKRKDGFDLAYLLCRLAEVASGMAYLHSKHITHGDLKAANVLLVNSVHGSFGQIAKLTDFGLSGILREGVTHHSTQNLGTISHCAPEVLEKGHMSPAADVYAFGIMMWELYTSSFAYKDLHYGTIIQRVVMGGQRPPVPPDTPEEYALLMRSCWAANPVERPTFQQILECLAILIQNLDATASASNLCLSAEALATSAAAAQQQQQPADPQATATASPGTSIQVARSGSGTSAGMLNSGMASSRQMHQTINMPDDGASLTATVTAAAAASSQDGSQHGGHASPAVAAAGVGSSFIRLGSAADTCTGSMSRASSNTSSLGTVAQGKPGAAAGAGAGPFQGSLYSVQQQPQQLVRAASNGPRFQYRQASLQASSGVQPSSVANHGTSSVTELDGVQHSRHIQDL